MEYVTLEPIVEETKLIETLKKIEAPNNKNGFHTISLESLEREKSISRQ